MRLALVKYLILALALQAGGINATLFRYTVTSHDVTIPYNTTTRKGNIQISTTFYFPSRHVIFHKIPLIIIMSGALAPKSTYSEFATRVAARGFVVVAADIVRPGFLPPGLAGRAAAAANAFKPGTCDPDGAFPLANFVPTLLRWLDEARDPAASAFGQVDTHRVAVIGHSVGGATTDVLAGSVPCIPQVPLCEFPLPVDNARRLKGLIYFEGVPENPFPMRYSSNSPPIMLFYANSANYSKMAYSANEHKVFALIQIPRGNHYSINNWIEYRSPKQINPCAPAEFGSDAQVNFSTTRTIHEEALSAVSTATARALRKIFTKDSSFSPWGRLLFKIVIENVRGIGEVKVRNLKLQAT